MQGLGKKEKKSSTFDFNMRKQFIFDLVHFVTISYKQLIFVAGTLVASCYKNIPPCNVIAVQTCMYMESINLKFSYLCS